MIGADPEVLESFLDRNAHRAAATPESDQEVRPEAGVTNRRGEPEGIEEQVVSSDVGLFHCYPGVPLLL
jgi:hypothetical protein